MKPRSITRFAALIPIAAPLALVFTAPFAQATIRTWTGGNGDWTAGAAGGFDGVWATATPVDSGPMALSGTSRR